jgi:hypothetical protein
MYDCMKRKSNEFENLGVRITKNGAWNQKIWALKAFRGKMVFLGGSGPIPEFLGWLDCLGTKDRALANFGDFQGFLWNFGGFKVV